MNDREKLAAFMYLENYYSNFPSGRERQTNNGIWEKASRSTKTRWLKIADRLIDEGFTRSNAGLKKVIGLEYHHACCDNGYKSQETLLKENALIGSLYLADDIKKAWGDDWNDAPACCNAGGVYPETVKGLVEVPIYLGKPLAISTLDHSVDANKKVEELVEALRALHNDTTDQKNWDRAEEVLAKYK